MFIRRQLVSHWPVTIFSWMPANPGLEFLQHPNRVHVFVLEPLASNRVLPLELPQNQLAVGIEYRAFWAELLGTLAANHQCPVLRDVVGSVPWKVHMPLVQNQPGLDVPDDVPDGHMFPGGATAVHRDLEIPI